MRLGQEEEEPLILLEIRRLHEELIEDWRNPSPDWLEKLNRYDEMVAGYRSDNYLGLVQTQSDIVKPYIEAAAKTPSRIRQLIEAALEQQGDGRKIGHGRKD